MSAEVMLAILIIMGRGAIVNKKDMRRHKNLIYQRGFVHCSLVHSLDDVYSQGFIFRSSAL